MILSRTSVCGFDDWLATPLEFPVAMIRLLRAVTVAILVLVSI